MNDRTSIPTRDVLGLPLAALTTRDVQNYLLEQARLRRRPARVGYLNADQVNRAFSEPGFAGVMGGLDVLYADGQAVVWTARWLGRPVPERVNAGDFAREFIAAAADAGLRLALLGGRSDETQRCADCFCAWAPDLKIVFMHHGFFSPGNETEQVRGALEAADPDLVMVGMGAPRQERLVLDWSRRGRPRVWWCVGALFEYYAGRRRRAPVWMRRFGLEWLFRLALEPRRLWRRYLFGNPLFLLHVARGRPVTFDH